MESIDGYDHLCMSLCICVLLLVVFWFCIYLVVDGVGYVLLCDLVVD